MHHDMTPGPTPQILLNGDQVEALREVLSDHADGGELQITQQGDRSIVCGFSLATIEITTSGTILPD
jgi:hypothetical protein